MPVLTFHLPADLAGPACCERLLREASILFAATLDAPLTQVRAFVQRYDPQLVALGGRPVSQGGSAGVYFTCVVLEDRSLQQRQELVARLTDLVSEVVGVKRQAVRGHVLPVSAQDWAIGGIPAAVLREAEVLDRESRG